VGKAQVGGSERDLVHDPPVGSARESAQFPTGVNDVLTLLVNSKTCREAAYKQRSEARETESMPLVTHTPLTLDISHRDLPNRVCIGPV
jgi:hypothetical protein